MSIEIIEPEYLKGMTPEEIERLIEPEKEQFIKLLSRIAARIMCAHPELMDQISAPEKD